jgi:hypothetical protein
LNLIKGESNTNINNSNYNRTNDEYLNKSESLPCNSTFTNSINFDDERKTVKNIKKINNDKHSLNNKNDSFNKECNNLNISEFNIPICSYISNIIEKHKMNLNIGSHRVLLKEYTSIECMNKMKSNGICEKVNILIDMLLRKMFLDIKNVTNSCKIDFLPISLSRDSTCSSEILKLEISTRIKNKGLENNDKCLQNYCFNCCQTDLQNLYSLPCDFCSKIS